MPEKETVERAREKKQQGKAPSTQAGEFVREEMEHIKEGKHGAKSPQQAVAIGLQKARRAGVDLPPPEKGRVTAKTRQSAQSAYRRGQEEGELKKRDEKKEEAGRRTAPRPSEKKAAAEKPAAKKTTGKKSAAKKPAAKKTTGKKSAAKKPAAKTTGKKAAPKKPAAKRSSSGK